jgi:hypothetical protein
LLFWRKDFAATSMNDLCDALSVWSPDLYAVFGSKGGAPSRSRAQLQTIGPPVRGNFEGLDARARPENCLRRQKRSFERRRSVFGDSPMRLRSGQSRSVADS